MASKENPIELKFTTSVTLTPYVFKLDHGTADPSLLGRGFAQMLRGLRNNRIWMVLAVSIIAFKSYPIPRKMPTLLCQLLNTYKRHIQLWRCGQLRASPLNNAVDVRFSWISVRIWLSLFNIVKGYIQNFTGKKCARKVSGISQDGILNSSAVRHPQFSSVSERKSLVELRIGEKVCAFL